MTKDEIDLIVSKITKDVEDRLIERGDERYVMRGDCNERQERVNSRFANDDKRIEIVVHDFKIIKWLISVVAAASGGSLLTSIIELLSR